MCLPLNVQVQSSKFVSIVEMVLFDYLFTLTMLYTLLGVGSVFLLWWFRSSITAYFKARVDPPSKPVDISTKSLNQFAAILQRGPLPYAPPADGAASEVDGSAPPAAPNGSKLPSRPRGEIY